MKTALLAFILASAVGARAAAAVLWPAIDRMDPCGGLGLQECIDFVQPGEVISVRTNGPIQQSLNIDKSLTLQAAAGFAPVLGASHSIFLTNPGSSQNVIRVEDFTLMQGRVRAVHSSLGPFYLTLRDLTIHNSIHATPEIEVTTPASGPYGAVFLEIANNHLVIPATPTELGADGISVDGGQAISMTGVIRNNRIDHFEGPFQGAIRLFNDTAAPFDIDVIGNEIRGSAYNGGIVFLQVGTGSASLRYLNNLVVGQTQEVGPSGAYVLDIQRGIATFEIVNNTAADGRTGVFIHGRDDLNAQWSGVVANNIVARMLGAGMSLQAPLQTPGAITNDHNLVFDVSYNSFNPGPGTLMIDPQFVGPSNYRLRDPSPARNTGNSTRVPADLTMDLDGNPRQVGHVDMGAYESSTTTDAGSEPTMPAVAALSPPDRCPTADRVRFQLDVPAAGNADVRVFDVRGRQVRALLRGPIRIGRHEIAWDTRDATGVGVPCGVYFVRARFGGFIADRRVVVVK